MPRIKILLLIAVLCCALSGCSVSVLDHMTVEEKIAQMMIVFSHDKDIRRLSDLGVGGFHIGLEPNEEAVRTKVHRILRASHIPPLITADLEGCRNPFEEFAIFPSLSTIKTVEEAYTLGTQHGTLLKDLGFTTNLAPVLDREDRIEECRSFNGSAEHIAQVGASYIAGVQSTGVMAVAKHYPGQTLSSDDLHLTSTQETITQDDLLPFFEAINADAKGILVGHQLVTGALDSQGMPASSSPQIVQSLRPYYEGLLITDDLGMQGARDHFESSTALIRASIDAGYDLVIFFGSADEVEQAIQDIAQAVKNNEISEYRLDISVARILATKGLQ
ncbi:hypothetical protein GF342_04805 [Candidatus Woesearchaeota archaeon]|nr:hypothetical protein [Candidatus Woesearchaeota archaeon]